jgi:hypothetical protein
LWRTEEAASRADELDESSAAAPQDPLRRLSRHPAAWLPCWDIAEAQIASSKRQATLPTQVVKAPRITELLLDVILFGNPPFTFASNPALQTLLSTLSPSYREAA